MPFIQDLRSLDAKATPGPWLHKHDDEDVPTSDVIDYNGDFVAFASADDDVGCHDAAIIALLRSHAARIAALVEAVGAYKAATDARETFAAEGPCDDTLTLARLCAVESSAYCAMVAALAALEAP